MESTVVMAPSREQMVEKLRRIVNEWRQNEDWPNARASVPLMFLDFCEILGLDELEQARLLGRKAFRYIQGEGFFEGLSEAEIPVMLVLAGEGANQ